MPRVPDTNASLILRLPSAEDAEAWREFVSIYEPFVYRFARRGGLQDADARELVQNVMLSVARAVGRWRPDRQRGRFRTWLFRIARNQLLDVLTKQQRSVVSRGGSALLELLNHAAVSGVAEQQLRTAHRRELFRWAADRVKSSVKEATWQAFWMTAVDDLDVEQVAGELGLTTGAVYIARSRVLARLRDEVQKWEDDDAMQ
ncbi:MAG: sigma-70 family RNA polymerase sigma factor [Planctomycetaceae bacterium]|nr:sigma-70 family RNA polymerase sigma factor [Planctomycetaceae bacterium]